MERPWDRAGALAGIAGAVIALVGLVVALLTWLTPQLSGELDEVSRQSPVQPGTLNESINPNSFAAALSPWPPGGDLIEENRDELRSRGISNTHVYGESTGKFTYQTRIDKFTGDQVKLTARLSANAYQYQDSENKYSDVTVEINGRTLPDGPVRVIPDDGRGKYYTWTFERELLTEGVDNTITFSVDENAKFPNGLCIYGDAVDIDGINERITLRSE